MKLLHCLPLAALFPALVAHAIEVAPGDYEQLPVGATLGMVYYQHASTDALYAHGTPTSRDANLDSDVGILRFMHVFALSERVTVDPQFLLPFGHMSGNGDVAALGSANGFGDLILAAPVRLRLNEARDVVAVTPYLYLPSGRYHHDAALNFGENRWKVDLQAAYIKHFAQQWALDVVGDAIRYGDNDDYGAASVRREQATSYALQVMGRYLLDERTSFGVGFGRNWGGENRLDGIGQDDASRTTNVRLTATTFVTPRNQVQLQLGRDLAVDNGLREDFRMNLRYAYVF